jgi:hypothetical protein
MKHRRADVSLADYVARMKEGQDKIYYLTGESYAQVKDSPHLEVFRKKGIEVLLLTDRIDEWLMGYLTEFDGKAFVDVARGDLDLGTLDSEEDKKAQEETAKAKEGWRAGSRPRWATKWPKCASPPPDRFAGDPRHRPGRPGPADAPDPGSQRPEGAGEQAGVRVQPRAPADRQARRRAGRWPFRRPGPRAVRPGRAGRRRQPQGPGRYVKRLNKLLLELSA